ncbi:MAG: hypothetical protein ABI585_16255 [Betaproteobacteria bacterium]
MRVAVALAVVVLAFALDSIAQMPGGMPSLSPAELAEANAACEQLAGIPNAPMSVQACKAMLGMAGTAQRMQEAAAEPSARRPGDETLGCEAIFAEMTSLGSVTLSGDGARKAEAAVAAGTAEGRRQGVAMTGFMAESFALGAVMGAASPVMPNFVAAAIVAAWQAKAVAVGTRGVAAQAALRPDRDAAIQETAADFERAMSANPRFARLAELGIDKRCEAPARAAR